MSLSVYSPFILKLIVITVSKYSTQKYIHRIALFVVLVMYTLATVHLVIVVQGLEHLCVYMTLASCDTLPQLIYTLCVAGAKGGRFSIDQSVFFPH